MKLLKSLLFSLSLFAAAAVPALEEGRAAPSFDATLLDGEEFSLARAAGQVVLINFWASWCPPCRHELPALDAYYRKHRNEGLKVIAISVDDPFNEHKVRAAMAKYSFQVGLAHDADFRPWGRISRIPLTFVVDRSGVLRRNGWTSDAHVDEAGLEKTVTPWLRQPVPPNRGNARK